LSEQFIEQGDAASIVDRLIAAAEAGDVITIMRRDEPVAVIISADEFDRLTIAVEAVTR
jgi:prevent-host-death family protein